MRRHRLGVSRYQASFQRSSFWTARAEVSASIAISSSCVISAKSSNGSSAECLREHGVVRSAGEQPALGGGREVRSRRPDRAGDGQARQLLVGRDDVDLVGDQPEAVAQVDERRR